MKSTTERRVDPAASTELIERVWDEEIVPVLHDYIRIPNKSPMFDAEWEANGHMDRAAKLIEEWCRARPIPGLTVERVQLEGRTPLLYMEVPAPGGNADADTVLLYGHLDKQPEMVGWRTGLGPWEPVLDGDRLYGRGGADDGYSAFASLTALQVLAEQGVPHARCVIVIEGCEESGSTDLPYYIDHLAPRIGEPSLVVCLDSGCGDYERLWSTTSLRGMAVGDLTVDVLSEGVHSGDASGIVPDGFRIARALMDRLEDSSTGRILPPELHAEIPADRRAQARATAQVLGERVAARFPFVGGTAPADGAPAELILNRTWRPALTVTGADGLPAMRDAGNVLRPHTALRLSLRLPPTIDGEEAVRFLKTLLEKDPPHGARVRLENLDGITGWNAPPLAGWLEKSVAAASRATFGKDAAWMGEGGSIPFMGMLGEKFPQAQFLITGVLGPESNAHGPNEFLHVPTGKRVTACVAHVVADHLHRPRD